MKADTQKRLWKITSDLRSQLAPGDHVSIISQLFVIEALTRRDAALHDLIKSAAKSAKLLTGDLLAQTVASLEHHGDEQSHKLIDPESSGWSSLSAGWILQALASLMDDQSTPLEKGRWLLSHAGAKTKGLRMVPAELLRVLADLQPQAESVYLLFDEASLSVLETTTEAQQVTVRPRSNGAYQLVCRALFVSERQATVQKLDPYSKADAPRADLIIVIPPFGERVDPARVIELPEIFQGSHRLTSEEVALASVPADAGQKVVALVPSGLLFRGGLSRLLREWLVDDFGLLSVTELPPRVLTNTSIGCAILEMAPVASLLFDTINLVSADTDQFLDEESSGHVSVSGSRELIAAIRSSVESPHEAALHVRKNEIRANDYVLNPARYRTGALDALIGHSRSVPLGNLVEIIRPLPVKDTDAEEGRRFREVLMSDFGRDSMIRQGSKERRLDSATAVKARRQLLQPGDVLLGVKGTIGKAAIVSDETENDLLAGQTTVILRLTDHDRIKDPAFLLRYLNQPAVIEHLESLAGGSAIAFIRAKDLAGLPVPVPEPEEQQEITQTHQRIVKLIAESDRLIREANQLNERAFNRRREVH